MFAEIESCDVVSEQVTPPSEVNCEVEGSEKDCEIEVVNLNCDADDNRPCSPEIEICESHDGEDTGNGEGAERNKQDPKKVDEPSSSNVVSSGSKINEDASSEKKDSPNSKENVDSCKVNEKESSVKSSEKDDLANIKETESVPSSNEEKDLSNSKEDVSSAKENSSSSDVNMCDETDKVDVENEVKETNSTRSLSLEDLVAWLREQAPLSKSQLQNLFITMADFQAALKCVQPSAKREGFATVPDVTWDDIGALKDIREELKLAVLVSFQSLTVL